MGAVLGKAVIVTDNAYKLAARYAYHIIRYGFFNAFCIEVELGRFVPDIIAGKYAVARYDHYFICIVVLVVIMLLLNVFVTLRRIHMTEQTKWEEYERYKNSLRLQPISDKEYEQKLKAKADELRL